MSLGRKISTTFMVFIVFLAVFCVSQPEAQESATVLLMFTFDTEDFLTPETNPVLGELVEILDKHGVKGEFYMVAEKARVLAEEYPDVLEALSHHVIGYHQNGHSVHPTIAEYSDGKPWREAVETAFEYETKRINIYTGELSTNETGGTKFVQNTFGRETLTFRPPGYVWSAPSLYALRELGIRASSVSSSFREVTGYTLNWYLDIVQIPAADVYLDAYLVQGDLDGLESHFNELRSQGRKLIIFGNHPCRLVTQAFWDLSYFGGQNPGDESNIELPALYERGTTRQALRNLDEFLGNLLSYRNVKVVTSEDFLAEAGESEPLQVLSSDDLLSISENLLRSWVDAPPSYVELSDGEFVSLTEAFIAFTIALSRYIESDVLPKIVDISAPWIPRVIGPTGIRPGSSEVSVDTSTLMNIVAEVHEYVEENLEVPSAIVIGDSIVGPADLLHVMAQAVRNAAKGENVTQSWTIRDFSELPTRSRLIQIGYGWPCLPPDGLNYTMQLEMARLQAWTLKPIPLISPSEVEPEGAGSKLIFEIVAIGVLASFFVAPLIFLIVRKFRRKV